MRLSLEDLRGKAVALTFIDVSCADTCSLLAAKMAGLRSRLGAGFGAKVWFVSITLDPDRDIPAVLRSYAEAHGAAPAGWVFLTGAPAEIPETPLRMWALFGGLRVLQRPARVPPRV
jgi:protein SCO1/2